MPATGYSAPSRRTVLSALGTAITAGFVGITATGAQEDPEYILVQGDRCTHIRPVRGERPVEAFYDYRLPEEYASEENGASVGDSKLYASAGTTDLQRPQTSIAFLYRDPNRLSLVVVHGSVGGSHGGSVTFTLSGLPADGAWRVRDDLYRNPETGDLASTNHDRWDVDGTAHRIDWTWGSGGTDGGVFGGLGDDFDVVVSPSFNEAAALSSQYYEGTVTDWEFLSGSDGQDRLSLSMHEPLRIATGSCGGDESAGSDRRHTADPTQTATSTQPVDGSRREQGDEDTSEDESEHEDAKREAESEREADEREGESDNEEEGDSRTVCHRPPGNPDNAHTIEVGSEAAVDAHRAHGDFKGPCR